MEAVCLLWIKTAIGIAPAFVAVNIIVNVDFPHSTLAVESTKIISEEDSNFCALFMTGVATRIAHSSSADVKSR